MSRGQRPRTILTRRHFLSVGFGIATVHPIGVAAEKRGPTRWAGQSSSSLSGHSASPIAERCGAALKNRVTAVAMDSLLGHPRAEALTVPKRRLHMVRLRR